MNAIHPHAVHDDPRESQTWLTRTLALTGAVAAALTTLLLTARSADMALGFFLRDPMMWAILAIAAVVGLCVGALVGMRVQRWWS